jgi:hypothetical protein
LLRRVIDRHLDQNDFYQDTNPIQCTSTEPISAKPEEHPFFSLLIPTRMNILNYLVNWSLSEHKPIKDVIDEQAKLKGRSSNFLVNLM